MPADDRNKAISVREAVRKIGAKVTDAFRKAGAGVRSLFSGGAGRAKGKERPGMPPAREAFAVKREPAAKKELFAYKIGGEERAAQKAEPVFPGKASRERPPEPKKEAVARSAYDALEAERLARLKKSDDKKAAPRKVGGVAARPRQIGGADGKVSLSARPSDETVIFREEPIRIKGNARPPGRQTQPVPDLPRRYKIGMLFKPREKKPLFALSVVLTVINLSFVVAVVLVAAGFGSVIGVAKAYLETTPDLDTTVIEDQDLTSYVLYPDGSGLATYSGAENRDWAAIDAIPETMKNAVIAVEDIRFYEHEGVDYRRLAGAFAANLSSSTVEGGSTITQQLVKNKLLTSEKSYKRKLQEAYLAQELEQRYTKDEILESYLNTIPLGGQVYGVKTAAKDYFGKELNQLTLRETVCIAAITQSTTRFNPRRATYVRPENLPYLIDRMNIITERMRWNEMISEEEYNEARIPASEYLDEGASYTDADGEKHLELADGYLEKWTREMNILTDSPANTVYPYPHFVEYVIYDVQTFLLQMRGLEDTSENRAIVDREMRQGGYKIYSTIDRDIQDAVQDTLAQWENYPTFESGVESVAYLRDSNGNTIEVVQPQATAAVVENSTGYLRAIVGSRTEPTSRRTLNRAAYMGPGTQGGYIGVPIGSSMKPLAVYGPAFDTDYGLGSGVANIPVPITGWPPDPENNDPGYPTTSSSRTGPISLHDAIVYSQNIAAARTLADYVGIDTSMQYLETLGVDTAKFDNTANGGMDNRTIVGLALGSAPMAPVEVAGAYSSIPRGGLYLQPVSFSHVLDSNDNVIIDLRVTDADGNVDSAISTERGVLQALKPSTAWMLNNALTDAVDHGTGTPAGIDGMHTAGKTGTVAYNRGACFTGYTPYYTSCLWVGHDDNKNFVRGSDAAAVCGPLWRAYMTVIHEGMTDREVFDRPPESFGLVEATVCIRSNLLPGTGCQTSTGWMASGDVPMEACAFCQGGGVIPICTASNMLRGPFCPGENWGEVQISNFPPDSPYGQQPGGTAGAVDPAAGGAVTATGVDTSQICNIHTSDWAASLLG